MDVGLVTNTGVQRRVNTGVQTLKSLKRQGRASVDREAAPAPMDYADFGERLISEGHSGFGLGPARGRARDESYLRYHQAPSETSW